MDEIVTMLEGSALGLELRKLWEEYEASEVLITTVFVTFGRRAAVRSEHNGDDDDTWTDSRGKARQGFRQIRDVDTGA